MSTRSHARASSRNLASRFDSGSSMQDHRRVVDQRPRDRHALLLAAGELVRIAVRRDGPATARPAPSSTRDAISSADDLAQLEAVGHVVEHGLVRPERVRLEHEAEVARLGRDLDAACRRRRPALSPMRIVPWCGALEPGDGAQQRRLAAARGPSSDTTSPRFSAIDTPFRIGLVAVGEVQVLDA